MLVTLDLCATIFRNTERMLRDRSYVIEETVSPADFFPSRASKETFVGDDDLNKRVFIRARHKALRPLRPQAQTLTPAQRSADSAQTLTPRQRPADSADTTDTTGASNGASTSALAPTPTPPTAAAAAPRARPQQRAPEVLAMFLAEENQSVGIRQMRELVDYATRNRHKRIIVIFQKEMKAQARQALEAIGSCLFEVFLVPQLMYIVVDHHLVPRHIPLSETKAKEELKLRRIKRNQLPVLRTSDPVAKYLGLKPGTVVCIIVPSNVSAFYIKFRQVKPG
jgi:DNA-directed RNA polymerase subunit H (RpoH/RPB5)